MKQSAIERMDCYSGKDLPVAKTCLCAVVSGSRQAFARAVRARGGCSIDVISPDKIKGIVSSGESDGRGAVTTGCVSVRDSLTLWLTAPFPSVQKARRVFPALLDVALPFPLEKCLYQFLDIHRTPEKTTRALAVAARRDSVEKLLEQYRSAGVDPEVLDHEGLALWTQSIREIPMQPGAARAVVHLSDHSATFVIGANGRFMGAYSVHAGADADMPDTLASQIQRYLSAEIKSGTPIQWAITGPGARNEGLVKALHEKLSMEWAGPVMPHQSPETFLLRALGSRALRREPLRCNLRCGNVVHPNIRRMTRRPALMGAVLLLASGLILCAANATRLIMGIRRFEQAKRETAALVSTIAPGERVPYGMEVAEVEKFMTRHAEMTAPFLDAFKPSLALLLADIVRAAQDHELGIETLSLKRESVSISGTAGDWDRCEIFAQQLSAMGYSVSLDRREAVADGPIRFSLKGDAITR